ncbi:MAG: hypothetical protein R2939_15520 [Kofleriaceae bacterium]
MAQDVTPGQRRFLLIWPAILFGVYAIIGFVAVRAIAGEKREADHRHKMRMSPDKVEPGLTAPDPLPPTGDFVPVSVGIYVDGVDNLSIKDSVWSGTFYAWFRWQGDPKLDPARSFQLVDARIDKREVVEEHAGVDGVNYQRARVTAKFTKYFNTTRVPLDDHLLTIRLEDAARDATQLRYVADGDSNISSRVRITGYRVAEHAFVVKPHTYRSTYGDPRGADRKTFTEYVFGISIERSSIGLYVKLLIGLFAGGLLTLLSFFLRPTDSPRFGFPTTAYFGAVANSYLISSMLPSSGEFGLVDYVTGIGFFTISVCLVSSLVSWHYYVIRKDEVFSQAFDRATRLWVFIIFVSMNLLLPISAFARL